jgi:EAL domain-containing protein (putative c-di-GMP-specific phosphodiesterase class I)
VILLENLHEVSDASLVAQRILETLSQPFDIEGNQIYVTASIGIAVSGPEYESPEELVLNADTAMYRAKAGGKARFEIFDSDMHSKAMARLQLENDMRRAVEREEFVVHYQPIVHLKTGRVDAFEALIRWNHPERGLVSPAEFIPVAEETGMIVPIGEFVMRQACRQTRAWQIKHPDVSNLRISVNLSVHEFSKPNLVETMERILFESGLDPRFLKLEITESAIMESIDFVTRTLKMLRERQIELSIDDFGTGYSSLCYLHRFPMDTLKIDQAFVREMHTTDENFHIVRTIVTLAQALNMSVVAEGIETEQQAEDLTRLGCEFGQGFLFSRPVSANQAETLILGKRESEADLAPPVS